jgi:hypothetical protein
MQRTWCVWKYNGTAATDLDADCKNSELDLQKSIHWSVDRVQRLMMPKEHAWKRYDDFHSRYFRDTLHAHKNASRLFFFPNIPYRIIVPWMLQ